MGRIGSRVASGVASGVADRVAEKGWKQGISDRTGNGIANRATEKR